ncbi:hypothetical protein JOD24_003418 [Kroppenstedtia sanguinis]|uniref:YIP1 family protein n=1 Tax=Kroppenstedtia sanguinis TaxID=1380684 RepID=UPI003D23C081
MNLLDSDRPWVSIWLHPQETIAEWVGKTEKKHLVWLICLSGYAIYLEQAAGRGLGDSTALPAIFLFGLIWGPLYGWITWFLIGGLSHLFSRLLDGKANWVETRVAFAWSTIPLIAKLLLWIPQLALFGKEMFTEQTPMLDSSPIGMLLFILFWIVDMSLNVWFFITLSKALGEVHRFSPWQGFFSLVCIGFIFSFLLVFMLLF